VCGKNRESEREREIERKRERPVIAPPYAFFESQLKERGISVARWN
jgi:hypothetical protein